MPRKGGLKQWKQPALTKEELAELAISDEEIEFEPKDDTERQFHVEEEENIMGLDLDDDSDEDSQDFDDDFEDDDDEEEEDTRNDQAWGSKKKGFYDRDFQDEEWDEELGSFSLSPVCVLSNLPPAQDELEQALIQQKKSRGAILPEDFAPGEQDLKQSVKLRSPKEKSDEYCTRPFFRPIFLTCACVGPSWRRWREICLLLPQKRNSISLLPKHLSC